MMQVEFSLGSEAALNLAYVGSDATPRVIPVGFWWTGEGANIDRTDVYGVRPMNPSSLVWTSASSGTRTRGPYWPL
jgi:hypothetical protein